MSCRQGETWGMTWGTMLLSSTPSYENNFGKVWSLFTKEIVVLLCARISRLQKKRFVGAVSVPCRFIGLTINHKDLIEKRLTFFLPSLNWHKSSGFLFLMWSEEKTEPPQPCFSPLLSSRQHYVALVSFSLLFLFFCVNLPLQLPCDWLSGKRAGHKGLSCAPVFLGDGRGHLNG